MDSPSTPVAHWIVRYLPNEIVGTVTAVASGSVVFVLTGSEAAGAVAATLGEGVGFYGVAAVRAWGEVGTSAASDLHGGIGRRMLRAVRALILEFGPAEVVDTVVARPLLMYVAALALDGAPASWLVGKLAADVVFYAIVIASVTLRRRWEATRPGPRRVGSAARPTSPGG